jgi:hypothetical protein
MAAQRKLQITVQYLYSWPISFPSRNPIRPFVLSFRLCGAGMMPKTRRIDYHRRIVCREDLAAVLVHVAAVTCLSFRSQTGPAAALGARPLVLNV